MSLPFFFVENLSVPEPVVTLNEETSRHVAMVLRMKHRDRLRLTDGKGNWIIGEISGNHKKSCVITKIETGKQIQSQQKTIIAISLLKNSNRFEWFIEKATEIGVHEIIPMICARTEKQQFRYDRIQNIMVSAMLQSQQVWLPVLHKPLAFEKILKLSHEFQHEVQRLIANCGDQPKQPLTSLINRADIRIILIGPEGDFTKDEIEKAIEQHFKPISLGDSRLRTETAGVVAAAIMTNPNPVL
jgi:16S rRNA (uracil1498-N3)-methyltransferase